MNRRNLVKAMLTLPVAGALSACRREPERRPVGKLKFFLQGAFGVVLHPEKEFRIRAVIPFSPERLHELRVSNPAKLQGTEAPGSKYPSYHFVLGDEGLEISGTQPHIDSGFYDFRFPDIGEPKEQEYFVTLDLPAPDSITYTPPAKPVRFGSKIAMMPFNHIFEYTVRNSGKVYLNSEQLGKQSPISCAELGKDYEEAQSQLKAPMNSEEESQYNSIEGNLKHSHRDCIAFFIGVGPSPDTPPAIAAEHGFRFFNDVLIPSFPTLFRRLKDEHKRLSPIGDCGQPAGQYEQGVNSAPMLMPAVWHGEMPMLRLLPVSAQMNCDHGGVLGP